MPEDPRPNWVELVKELLNCQPDRFSNWVESHCTYLQLDLLQAIKDYTNSNKISDSEGVDRLTRYAQSVAELMPDEPLAIPLAAWARGIWEMYRDPYKATEYFQQALAGYETAPDKTLDVARILTNLIYVLSECGSFQESETDYHRVLPEFERCKRQNPNYLLVLEQNYGLSLHTWGHYHEAIAAYQRAYDQVEYLEEDVRAIPLTEIQVNYAMTSVMLGQLSEGVVILLQERQIAQTNGQNLTAARINMNLGNLYTALGQPALALYHFHLAREGFEKEKNQMEVGSVFMREGALFQRIGVEFLARRSYTQAQAEFRQKQMKLQLVRVLIQQAILERTFGKFSNAKSLLDEAETNWQTSKRPYWLIQVSFERIELLLMQGDGATALKQLHALESVENNMALAAQRDLLRAEALRLLAEQPSSREKARQAYKSVIDYASSEGDRWMQRRAVAGLGQLLLMSEPDAGRLLLEEAVAYDDQTRQMLSVEEFKASFQAQTSDLLPILASWATNQKKPVQALAYMWRAKSSAFADLRQSIELEQTDESEQEILQDIRQTREDLAVWYLKREKAADRGTNREAINKKVQALEQHLIYLRRQRNHQQIIENAKLFDAPKQWLAQMDADVLLEYICCGGDLLGVCADQRGYCQAIWLGKESDIRRLLGKLQFNFSNFFKKSFEERLVYREQWRAEYLPVLERLYKQLVAPLLTAFEQPFTHRRVLIAPCDSLSLLPFAAFWDGQHHLIEHYELEFIWSGGLLALPRITVPHQALSSPVIITASDEGRLTATGTEASAVADVLRDSVCLVDTPHAINYLTKLSAPPRLLHIAADTKIHQDLPILSALQLSKERLSVEQAYELPLAGTPLVTLSACLTASGMNTGGALLAFQSAFFIAGVQRIISSLWRISDKTTPEWMQQFYRFYTRGLTPTDALRQTQLLLLTDPAYKAYSHPAIWAAFICSRC